MALFSASSYFSLDWACKIPTGYHDWRQATFARIIASVLILFFIWQVTPQTLTRFRFPKFDMNFIWVLLAMVYFNIPHFRAGQVEYGSFGKFLSVFIFSIGIGLNEEILSRGLIFSIFEKKSVWVATAVSAISFGAMHIPNMFLGQDRTYTIMQVITASASGVLLAGLMIYSGSIWVPILMHTLWDFPLVTIKNLGRHHYSLSPKELLYEFLYDLFQVAVGLCFIWMAKSRQEECARANLRMHKDLIPEVN